MLLCCHFFRQFSTVATDLGLRLFAFLIASVCVCSAVLPVGTAHANDMRRVIVVETMTLPYLQSTTRWIRDALDGLGYKDGQSIDYTVLNAQGNLEQANRLLADALAKQKVDLVVSVATLASRAARQTLKGQTLPQVFAIVADPVGEGFVPAIGRKSGSNITGNTHVVPATAKLRVVAQSIESLTKERPFRIGLLHSTYPSAVSDSAYLFKEIGDFPEIDLSELVFNYRDGDAGRAEMREAAVALIKANAGKLDGLWLAVGPNQLDKEFLETILKMELPVLYTEGELAGRAGAMLGLRSSPENNGRAAAALVDAIFKGANASDIPVSRPDAFSVTVNLTTATKIGAVIPSHILELAGENIYR